LLFGEDEGWDIFKVSLFLILGRICYKGAARF
jgi:hypothetical protein